MKISQNIPLSLIENPAENSINDAMPIKDIIEKLQNLCTQEGNSLTQKEIESVKVLLEFADSDPSYFHSPENRETQLGKMNDGKITYAEFWNIFGGLKTELFKASLEKDTGISVPEDSIVNKIALMLSPSCASTKGDFSNSSKELLDQAFKLEAAHRGTMIPKSELNNITWMDRNLSTPEEIAKHFAENKTEGQEMIVVVVKTEMCRNNHARPCAITTALLEQDIPGIKVYMAHVESSDSDGSRFWQKKVKNEYNFVQGPGAAISFIDPNDTDNRHTTNAANLNLRLKNQYGNGYLEGNKFFDELIIAQENLRYNNLSLTEKFFEFFK